MNIEQKTTQLRIQKNVQGRHDASAEFAFHIPLPDARGEGVQMTTPITAILPTANLWKRI